MSSPTLHSGSNVVSICSTDVAFYAFVGSFVFFAFMTWALTQMKLERYVRSAPTFSASDTKHDSSSSPATTTKKVSEQVSGVTVVNTFISLIHASLASLLITLTFLDEPKLIEPQNLILGSTYLLTITDAFVMGYFAWDCVHLLLSGGETEANAFGVWFHHIIIIICLGAGLQQCCYIAVQGIVVFAECHSIFLHARRIWLWFVPPQELTKLYTVYFRFFHYVSILIFRFFVCGYALWFVVTFYQAFPVMWCWTFAFVGMVSLNCVNVYLVIGLWKSDSRILAKANANKKN